MPNVKAAGSIHSHPGPNRKPSQADLNIFSKTGNCHIIVGYPYDKQSWTCYDREENIRELRVIDEKFEDFEEDNLKGTTRPGSDKVTDIEFYDNRVIMKDENVDCQIIANKVDDMEPYIRTLFDWVTTVWDYSIVDDWNTDEYSVIHIQEDFFRVHKLGKDDIDGLFQGKYEWSPEPLNDYEDREIQAYVYIRISEDEYVKLLP
jgi:hypothetical protein